MQKHEPLRVVLSLRERHQDAAERSLSDALVQQKQAERLLSALQDDLRRTIAAPHEASGTLLNIVEIQQRAMRIPHLRQLCTQAQTALAERKAHVVEQQQRYLEARRAREVVGALLKQRKQQAQDRQNRQDTKVSEDLFLGRMMLRTGAEDPAT